MITLYFTWIPKNYIVRGTTQKVSNARLSVPQPNAFATICTNTIRLRTERSSAERQDASVGIFTTFPFMAPKTLDAPASTLTSNMTSIKRPAKLVLAKDLHPIGHVRAE